MQRIDQQQSNSCQATTGNLTINSQHVSSPTPVGGPRDPLQKPIFTQLTRHLK